MNDLPEPEIVHCSVVDGFPSRLAVLHLHWPEPAHVTSTRLWQFPGGVKILSAPPQRFGIQVLRHGSDFYSLVLVWGDLCLRWAALTRAEILTGSLAPFLKIISTDLFYLLDQPIPLHGETSGKIA